MVAQSYDAISEVLSTLGYRGVNHVLNSPDGDLPDQRGIAPAAESPGAAEVRPPEDLTQVKLSTPAAAHAMLVARLLTDGPVKGKVAWFRHVLVGAGLEASDIAVHGEQIRLLDALFEQVVRELGDDGFEFQLLLPEDHRGGVLSDDHQMDDTDGSAGTTGEDRMQPDYLLLAGRIGAVGDWCRVFGSEIDALAATLSDTSQEFLADLRVIGEALPSRSLLDDPEIERSSADLMELEEYLRVGVMLLFEELQRKMGNRTEHAPDEQD